jgi:hypothetical protein
VSLLVVDVDVVLARRDVVLYNVVSYLLDDDLCFILGTVPLVVPSIPFAQYCPISLAVVSLLCTELLVRAVAYDINDPHITCVTTTANNTCISLSYAIVVLLT